MTFNHNFRINIFKKASLSRNFEETDEITNWFNNFNHADNSFKPNKLQGLGSYIVSEWVMSIPVEDIRRSRIS